MKECFTFIIFIVLILLNPATVFAGRGCCSHHGGQNYCDTNVGEWVCNDGTYSPSCRCEKIVDDYYSDDNYEENLNYSTYEEEYDDEFINDNENYEKTNNDNIFDDISFPIIISIIGGYLIFKKE